MEKHEAEVSCHAWPRCGEGSPGGRRGTAIAASGVHQLAIGEDAGFITTIIVLLKWVNDVE